MPWNSQLPVHPLRKLILPSEESPSSASVIYLFLLEHSYKPLSITTVWAKDLNEDVHVLFSDQVWGMFKLSSKNPKYQMISQMTNYVFAFGYVAMFEICF